MMGNLETVGGGEEGQFGSALVELKLLCHPGGAVEKAGDVRDCAWNTDLSQKDTFWKFHHLLEQAFLDSECPLPKEHYHFSCNAGFTKVPNTCSTSLDFE